MTFTEVLDAIVLCLMIAIWASVYHQRNFTRLVTAYLFVIVLLLHDFIFHAFSENEFYYYITAGVANLCVILAIEKMRTHTKLSGQLQIVCLVSIVLNLFGFHAYMSGQNSDVYMVSYVVLYVWVVYILNTGDPLYGSTSMDTRLSTLFSSFTSSGYVNSSNEET